MRGWVAPVERPSDDQREERGKEERAAQSFSPAAGADRRRGGRAFGYVKTRSKRYGRACPWASQYESGSGKRLGPAHFLKRHSML
jgi:hypothetical protein